MVVLALLMVKLLLDGVWFHDPLMEELMSCMVPSLPPRLISLSLVPELTPTTQLKWLQWLKHCLSFVLWPGMISRAFITTLSACCWSLLGHDPHVQLGLACQRPMILAQRKLRPTMQHVYGHSGNLGNECAGHAAAFGTSGFTSSHNVTTCWIHHNFDATACFDGCHSITDILERLQDTVSLSQYRIKHCVHHRVHRTFCAFHVTYGRLCLLLSAFSLWVLASSNKWWTDFLHPRLPYRVSTTTSSTTCGILCWNCFYFRLPSRGNRLGHDRAVLSLCSWFTLIQRRRVWVCMMLHRALLSMEFLYVVAPLPSWQHRASFVVDAFATKFCPGIYAPLLVPFTLVRYCILLWLLMNLEVYLFVTTFPLSWCCLVQVVTSSYTVQNRSVPENVSFMMEHSCYINGEAMVPFRPFSLQLSCSLSNVFLRWVAPGLQPFLQGRLV